MPLLKYVWIHAMVKCTEELHVDYEKNLFVILAIPMAIVTAVGHAMSFASGSLVEGIMMEGMSAGFEDLEYFT